MKMKLLNRGRKIFVYIIILNIAFFIGFCSIKIYWRIKPVPLVNLAIIKGEASRAKNLIANGADVNADSGRTGPPVLLASLKGYEDIVIMLIKHGADINRTNYAKDSALMVAASEGQFSIVKKLVDSGAELNLKNNDGATALDWAVGRPEIYQYLQQHGAKGTNNWDPKSGIRLNHQVFSTVR